MRFEIIIFLLFIVNIQCLHFYLTEGQAKCFQDDIPANTQVIIYWHMIDGLPGILSNSTTEGVKLQIKNPEQKILKEVLTTKGQDEQSSKGKYSFATPIGGEYKFCVQTTTSHWLKENAKIRYGLRLQVGEIYDTQNAVTNKELLELQKKMQLAQSKANDFIKYQDMQRKEEDELSSANLSINERVVIFTVLQTIIILASGIFQIISLRKYFIQKRLF
eukprot:TRINITY_DN23776_c0_g1_i1.p1 TRINITY_DN23776_c0_g1~~TRINITY_DN23776_c0_g1_i1.p1  ORF type:complete len:218 (-),score=47.32 TRINITY_DN23776_c0_g1_i1:239-892(-)